MHISILILSPATPVCEEGNSLKGLKGFLVKRGYNNEFFESQVDRMRLLDCSPLLCKDL